MTTAEEFAPAKINLTLHVTGQRADGYHLLDSLVVFADVGDRISMREAQALSLSVKGPMSAGVPTDASNLVLRAAQLMPQRGAEIELDKHLPPASGIGGGSADAAATLRASSRMSNGAVPSSEDVLSLGADVPVCLAGRTMRMSGIGEDLTPVPDWPQLDAVLVNPGIGVSTPGVFRALPAKANAPMPDVIPALSRADDAVRWLTEQRNDLQLPAMALAPDVADVLEALRAQTGCQLARMSGSGATCFGIFADRRMAARAADALHRARPGWWVTATRLG